MKQSINKGTFADAFKALRPDNFSFQGLEVLWDYLEQWEAETGEELELDVIAFCCDFSEDTTENIADAYDIDLSDCEDEEEKEDKVRDYLSDNGAYVGDVAGGFVYRGF